MASALIEEASAYAEKHKVFQLFESLLQELVVHKPDKPIDHLIKTLKRKEVPKLIVAGPPGAEIRSLCEVLAAKANLVHVVASDVWRELAKLQIPCGLQAKALEDDGKPVPPELMLTMLKEKLGMGECVSNGWILEGFPTDAGTARKLCAAGLLPTRFIHVDVPDSECLRRLTGRRIDTATNTVYHIDDKPPPAGAALEAPKGSSKEEVSARLVAYRSGMAGALPCFSSVLKELDGGAPGEKGLQALLTSALPLVTTEMPTRAPRGCPRVLLAGGPGSNVEALGAALAATYGAKHISAIELLHGAALNGGKQAAKAMEKPQPLLAADSILGPLLVGRLKEEDVRTAGFVLTGFPSTTMQAAFLAKNGVWLRHVVHLELAPKAAEALVTGTRYDPVDGEIYHVDNSPPSDEATLKRLVIHPKDELPAFKAALKTWSASLADVKKYYKDMLTSEDAARPMGELVERLAPCFLSL